MSKEQTNGNEIIYASEVSSTGDPYEGGGFLSKSKGGLTKREYFASLAMQGLLANSYGNDHEQQLLDFSEEVIAHLAVNHADSLIKALNDIP